MTRAPGAVLAVGVVGAVTGVLLLAARDREPALAWYGTPTAVLGLVLIGLWGRSRRQPEPVADTPETLAANLPGPWYPFAVAGIAAALLVWFIYWTKAR